MIFSFTGFLIPYKCVYKHILCMALSICHNSWMFYFIIYDCNWSPIYLSKLLNIPLLSLERVKSMMATLTPQAGTATISPCRQHDISSQSEMHFTSTLPQWRSRCSNSMACSAIARAHVTWWRTLRASSKLLNWKCLRRYSDLWDIQFNSTILLTKVRGPGCTFFFYPIPPIILFIWLHTTTQ